MLTKRAISIFGIFFVSKRWLNLRVNLASLYNDIFKYCAVHLNNELLSLVVHADMKEASIAEDKQHLLPRVKKQFKFTTSCWIYM